MSVRPLILIWAFIIVILTGAVTSHPRILRSKSSSRHRHRNNGLELSTQALTKPTLRGSTTDAENTSTGGDAFLLAPPPGNVRIKSSLRTIPHDRNAFTEGLLLHDGYLYESVGLRGKSGVRKTNVVTGETELEQTEHMGSHLFGEGIVVFENKLYQLTYKAKKGFVLDAKTFEMIDTFDYSVETGEGWGFTHNGEHLIVSDGSHNIYFWDPETLEEVKRISVQEHDTHKYVKKLNELEYVLGEILANIWYAQKIARIDPETGNIIGYIHLNELHAVDRKLREDCWNGIAYDAENQELILSGKNFLNTYVVKWPPAEE